MSNSVLLKSLVVLCSLFSLGLATDKLTVKSAIYGDIAKGKKVDVSEKVSKLVKEGALRLEASNDLFGDPAEGVNKKLVVSYELNGMAMETTVDEGDTLLLPLPKLEGDIKILSAEYGELPNGSTYDVLSIVKRSLKSNRVELAVDNEQFGDPAPGALKRLRVEYQIGEVKLAKSAYEGGKLVIELPKKGADKKDTLKQEDATKPASPKD
jgi:hypothetical protein